MAIAAKTQFHVLAVDDSIIDRKLIERLLKTSSYQVTTVDSGSKALQFLGLMNDLQENSPSPSSSSSSSSEYNEIEVNMVITDYCMPGMTGYDLLKKIKESQYLKDIPVVIMSSENEPSRINRCLEEGADDFLLKPVKLADVSKLRPFILKSKNKDEIQEEQNQTQTQSQACSKKRKLSDVGLSPERTRPRLSTNSSVNVL